MPGGDIQDPPSGWQPIPEYFTPMEIPTFGQSGTPDDPSHDDDGTVVVDDGSGNFEDPNLIRPPWMPEELWNFWIDEYVKAGGAANPNAANWATEQMRRSPAYDKYFPGIKREDGSIRYGVNPEQTYLNNIAAFRNIVEGLDLNADLFTDEYIQLIIGDVSPNEFRTRVTSAWDRVTQQGAAIRAWYSQRLGINMTDQAILASLMSPNIEQAILDRRLTMAEIGGTATQKNFNITDQFVAMLADNGMNIDRARQLFGSAERLLPMLSRLAARHGNPDDTFDIEEYAAAVEFEDPFEIARLSLVQAQEASTVTGGAAVDYRRSRYGGLSGLAEV